MTLIQQLTQIYFANKQYIISQILIYSPESEPKIKGGTDSDILNIFFTLLSSNKAFADKIQNDFGKNTNQHKQTPYTDAPPLDDYSAPVPESQKFDWAGTLGGLASIFGAVSTMFNKPNGSANTLEQAQAELDRIKTKNEKKRKQMNAFIIIGGSVLIISVVGFMIYATKKSKK